MPPSFLGFRPEMVRHSSGRSRTEQHSALVVSVDKPVLPRTEAINRILIAHGGANMESGLLSSVWQQPGRPSLVTDQAERLSLRWTYPL